MLLALPQTVGAQDTPKPDSSAVILTDSVANDSIVTTMVDDEAFADADGEEAEEGGFHKQLKTKFIDGNVGFMSLVALALVLGLAFCIERILYLMMSEIKSRKLLDDALGKQTEVSSVILFGIRQSTMTRILCQSPLTV